MAEYVKDLPEGSASRNNSPDRGVDQTDKGLAKEMKDAHLTAQNKPAQEVTRNRPAGVVVAMALMFMGAAWVMPFIFLMATDGYLPPTWVGLGVSISTMIGVAAAMAMFMMKRISVPLYTLVVILNNVIILLAGEWHPLHLVLPLAILAVAYSQWKHLD